MAAWARVRATVNNNPTFEWIGALLVIVAFFAITLRRARSVAATSHSVVQALLGVFVYIQRYHVHG